MSIYTVADLEIEGVGAEALKTQLKIERFGKTYIRDRDLPKKFQTEAIKLSREHQQKGIDSFVVETALFVTVWKEEKTEKIESGPVEKIEIPKITLPDTLYLQNVTVKAPKDSETSKVVPTEKQKRKYRGVEI